MGRTMNRSKQQILLRFLPGKTFDFERVAAIARVESIRGALNGDLNLTIVVNRICEEARAWQTAYRPSLLDNVLNDPASARFVLLNPLEVRAELFPKVFWCQNRACGRVLNCESWDSLPTRCRTCRGALAQLRFVKVHRCGEIKPLLPRNCNRCHTAQHMALDTRGSERISNFRWVCRNRGCSYSTSVFADYCTNCQWPNADPQNKLQQMQIEVHRAGSTYYPHTTVLLNLPNRAFEAFLNVPEWQCVAAARFLGLIDRPLSEFRPTANNNAAVAGGLSGEEVQELLRRFDGGEINAAQLAQEMQQIDRQRREQQQTGSAAGIAGMLVERTGVSQATWESAGQEMLEAVLPLETGSPVDLEENANDPAYQTAANAARRMGLRIKRLDDFPMLTANYGYSRVSCEPNQCHIKPFPPDREHSGRYPIYVDQVQADALLVSLDPARVWRWLDRNGFSPGLPAGTDERLARQAYFVRLLTAVSVRETIVANNPEARMVFGLLHTLSHLCVRQASLLCGLDSTSLSEYLLPRALTLAVYANHRSGATIGALTALFEQTLAEWLNSIRATRRCVYDPVCYEREGNCHACTHLAETSCRFFNLNLSRAFLFGGMDKHLGRIEVGYFDPSL